MEPAKVTSKGQVTVPIVLYHGTTYDFAEIDVQRGKPFKDFGQGFYATQNRESAVNMALRNRDIEIRRLQRRGITREVTPWFYITSLVSSFLGRNAPQICLRLQGGVWRNES